MGISGGYIRLIEHVLSIQEHVVLPIRHQMQELVGMSVVRDPGYRHASVQLGQQYFCYYAVETTQLARTSFRKIDRQAGGVVQTDSLYSVSSQCACFREVQIAAGCPT